MTSITIRKLDEELAQRLCIRAAKHGCSMEEEARNILRAALEQETAPTESLGTALHAIFKPFGGVALEIPPREPMREPPRFDK